MRSHGRSRWFEPNHAHFEPVRLRCRVGSARSRMMHRAFSVGECYLFSRRRG